MKKRKNPTMLGKKLKNADLIEHSYRRPGSTDPQNHSSHLVRFADVFSEPYTSPGMLCSIYSVFIIICYSFMVHSFHKAVLLYYCGLSSQNFWVLILIAKLKYD